MNAVKFKSIPHFSFSETVNEDDYILYDTSNLNNIIISEKRDGENTSLYTDKTHARSIDSNYHESRSWIKKFHSEIKNYIDSDIIIRGENLYAKHSIHYKNLTSYFEVFQIQKNDEILSWEDTLEVINRINSLNSYGTQLITVPVIYKGIYNEKTVKEIIKQLDTSITEGIVVRNADSFNINDFGKNIVKWVRKNHVQTSEHWMKMKVIPNELINI